MNVVYLSASSPPSLSLQRTWQYKANKTTPGGGGVSATHVFSMKVPHHSPDATGETYTL